MNDIRFTTPRHFSGTGTRRELLAAAAFGIAGGVSLLRADGAFASTGRSLSHLATAMQSGYPWVANHGLSGDAYQEQFDSLTSQGYRLLRLCGYNVAGQDLYASIWDQSPGPAWVGMHRVSGSDYQGQFEQLTAQGFRPVDISGYELNGSDAYTAIFEQSEVNGWSAHHGVLGGDYQGIFEQNAGNGLRPVRVSGYTVGGQDYFASIWIGDDGSGWSAVHGVDNAGYQAQFDSATGNGMRLADISGYEWNGTDYYTAIFDYSSSSYWIAHHNLSADAYQRAFDENGAAGYQLTAIAGYGVQNEARYAAIWATNSEPTGGTVGVEAVDQLANNALSMAGVPGMTVAIGKDGMLVYAKGYGTADKSTGEAVTVNTRMRIASVSKPITAVAIVQLAEAGMLTLDDKVFGDNSWFGYDYGTTPYPSNLTDITIDHLLTHTSGGWGRDSKTDTMFWETGKDHDELISWTIDTYPPENMPGTDFDYSNFGFCLLGRIIERATGQTYESWMQANTLAQCGISDMQIAGDSLAERATNEAVYDGSNSTIGDPYGIPVHRMDSHGGWIATATDLLKFLVHTDGLNTAPDIIRSDSTDAMTTGTVTNPGYGRGWGIATDNVQWGHNGELGGTISVVSKQFDGFYYALIANGNGIDLDQLGRAMCDANPDWGTGTVI